MTVEVDKEPADMTNDELLYASVRRFSYAVNNIQVSKDTIEKWRKREKLPPSDTVHELLKTHNLIYEQINSINHILFEIHRRSLE